MCHPKNVIKIQQDAEFSRVFSNLLLELQF